MKITIIFFVAVVAVVSAADYGLRLPGLSLTGIQSLQNAAAGVNGVSPLAGLLQNILVAVEKTVEGLIGPLQGLLVQILNTVTLIFQQITKPMDADTNSLNQPFNPLPGLPGTVTPPTTTTP